MAGDVIATKAVIKKCTITRACEQLEFAGATYSSDQVRSLSYLVKEGLPIRATIKGPRGAHTKTATADALIKSCTISKDGDKLNFDGFKYKPGEVAWIKELVNEAIEIEFSIRPVQGSFNFEE